MLQPFKTLVSASICSAILVALVHCDCPGTPCGHIIDVSFDPPVRGAGTVTIEAITGGVDPNCEIDLSQAEMYLAAICPSNMNIYLSGEPGMWQIDRLTLVGENPASITLSVATVDGVVHSEDFDLTYRRQPMPDECSATCFDANVTMSID